MIVRLIAYVVLLAASQFAHAQSLPIGKALYATACTNCHAANPSQDSRMRRATSLSMLRSAISGIGEMNYLSAVLSTQDMTDMAAYIASPSSVQASTDSDRLLNWAEWKYQTVLLPRAGTQTISGYAVRYYSQAGIYIGIANGTVYLYQPSLPNAQITDIGMLSAWLGMAARDGF